MDKTSGKSRGSSAAGGPWANLEGFLEDIIDTMADPLFVKDEQFRFLAVNKALCELMGQPRSAILGKTDLEFFSAEEAEVFRAKDEEVFRTGVVNINEESLTDADGETFVIVTKKAVYTDSTGRKILVGTIRDVTEQKRMEDALRQARDELELRVVERTREVEEAQASLRQAQKMEAVGQLTGGVAHDFNNLLAVVAGNLELSREFPAGDSRSDELIGQALAATARGATLIQRLLAFSRRQALRPRATDVGSLIEGMLDLIRRTLGETIEIEASPVSVPCCSHIDPAQLETALINLCINSRDAMPGGGKVAIRTDTVSLGAEKARRYRVEPGRYVLIEVTDNGTGMDGPTIESAFDPFFTTKEAGKGSGLGLSMVYGFVRQSSGHVDLASTAGGGTVVQMFLPECPARDVVSDAEPEAGVAVPKGAGECILLVEDEPAVRQMTSLLLQGLDYRVHAVSSVDEAMALLPELEQLDLLLADVVLAAGGSGHQVANEIRSRRPDVEILFMSGYAANTLDPEWLRQGHILLNKPFSRAELAHAIRRTLAGG